MTSLVTSKRYMATIALRAPGCRQPSRHRWQASNPSWVGLRTGRELEERRISFFTAIKFCQTQIICRERRRKREEGREERGREDGRVEGGREGGREGQNNTSITR